MHGVPSATTECCAFPASDAVANPELANPGVAMGQGDAVGGQGMREESRIEIEPQSVRPGPIDPTREMFRAEFRGVFDGFAGR